MKATTAKLTMLDGREWVTKVRVVRGQREVLLNEVWTPVVRTVGRQFIVGPFTFKQLYYSKHA